MLRVQCLTAAECDRDWSDVLPLHSAGVASLDDSTAVWAKVRFDG